MPGRATTDATGMAHRPSWFDDLHLRLLVRWERRRPPLPYSDRIDRESVVPRDRAGRPGTGDDGTTDLLALAQDGLDHVLAGSHGLRVRQLAAPYATSLTGAPAAAFQVEVESSPHRHVHTDTIVSYDGWLLTVGCSTRRRTSRRRRLSSRRSSRAGRGCLRVRAETVGEARRAGVAGRASGGRRQAAPPRACSAANPTHPAARAGASQRSTARACGPRRASRTAASRPTTAKVTASST